MHRSSGAVAGGLALLAMGMAAVGHASDGPGTTSDLAAGRAEEVERRLHELGDVGVNDDVLGTIEIVRVGVSAPILSGVDDVTIRRSVGHFPETPPPFQGGNMALAAHRTTHFRGLRHVRVGDRVVIRTTRGELEYKVEATWVVDPEDVWVLDPTEESALTLVTCYPFDFPGHAPQRFVVRARAASTSSGS